MKPRVRFYSREGTLVPTMRKLRRMRRWMRKVRFDPASTM